MQLDRLQIAQPQPANMLLQAMGMKDQMRRTDIAEDRNEIARERMLQDQEAFEFNKKQAIFAQSRDFIPDLKREDFGNYKKWLGKLFPELSELLPDQETVNNMPESEWYEIKKKIEVGTDNFSKMQQEQYKSFQEEIKAQKDQQRKIELESQKSASRMDLEKYKQSALDKRQKEKQFHEKNMEGTNVDDDYNKSLTNAYGAIESGANPSDVFLELKKSFPSKSKDLLAIEKGIKAVADLPEDLQQALEVNAIAINNGELDAEEVARKLGADWPEHATLINRILIKRKPGEDLATVLKAIFPE